LTRDEFMRALELLKISDLSNQDVDVLMLSIDVDSDGYIRYKEFVRKLSRHGVRSRTSEEQIIYLIVEALKRSRVKSLSDAFELIDKEGRGTISRDDFKDIFKSLNLKLDTNDIDKFIDHFWKDKTAGIDYQEFLRIFNRY
jgi:Ca2+-binding EF-hand superfamily protein